MHDCANVSMREQLPELLHGRLPADARAEVERHLASCVDCAEELALLRTVQAVTRAPAVDVERIVTAIPPYRPTTVWQRAVRVPALRVAAAILLFAGLSAVWYVGRKTPAQSMESVAQTPAPAPAPVSVQTPPTQTATSIAAHPATTRPVAGLSFGEPLGDLSDVDLRALAEAVDALDPVISTETDADVSSRDEGTR